MNTNLIIYFSWIIDLLLLEYKKDLLNDYVLWTISNINDQKNLEHPLKISLKPLLEYGVTNDQSFQFYSPQLLNFLLHIHFYLKSDILPNFLLKE